MRLLLGSQFVAQFADGVAQAAFAEEVVLDPAAGSTPARILAVFALTLLPYSVIAPFLGVLVDRWARRTLLVGTNVARGVLLLGVPLWAALVPGDAVLYAALLALLGLGRLFLTTKGAALPVVLHERALLQGNALSGGGGMIAAVIGGACGLGAVAALDSPIVFALAGIGYGLAALGAALIPDALGHGPRPSDSVAGAVARVAGELVAGLRAVWARRRARLSLTGVVLLRTAVMVTAIAAVLVIQARFPDASDRFGRLSAGALALGTTSAGALLGAALTPALGRRWRDGGLIALGFVVCGSGLVALGGVLDLRALLALTFLCGFGAYIAKIATDAQLQGALPDSYRGRAFALYDILYNLASVVAAGVFVAASEVSARGVLVTTGGLTLALAVGLAVAMRRAGMVGRAAW